MILECAQSLSRSHKDSRQISLMTGSANSTTSLTIKFLGWFCNEHHSSLACSKTAHEQSPRSRVAEFGTCNSITTKPHHSQTNPRAASSDPHLHRAQHKIPRATQEKEFCDADATITPRASSSTALRHMKPSGDQSPISAEHKKN